MSLDNAGFKLFTRFSNLFLCHASVYLKRIIHHFPLFALCEEMYSTVMSVCLVEPEGNYLHLDSKQKEQLFALFKFMSNGTLKVL